MKSADAWLWLLIAWLLASTAPFARTSESPRAGDELKRKQEEVDRLQRELDNARKELRRLEEENKRLKNAQPEPRASTEANRAEVLARPIASLPPLAESEVVESSELAAHFANQPEAALQRYVGRVFQVKGKVERFDVKLVVRRFDALLDTGARGISVVCGFNYVDKYLAVYTKQKGRTLVARAGAKGEVELMNVGDTVVIRGRCKGFKDGEVTFTGCEIVR
ncbi:MAG: hypothetical protein QHJ82_10625 [Verrucomicrobiota bacterium]|nr:hypothetical protein [Verrucomicrobiota bacterium]